MGGIAGESNGLGETPLEPIEGIVKHPDQSPNLVVNQWLR
jgi:hypothetical protein